MSLVTPGICYELASNAGLEVFDIKYDTAEFEFYGSEMFPRGIPLADENSPWINTTSALFTKDEMDGFKILAKKVGWAGQAGRATFFLPKVLVWKI